MPVYKEQIFHSAMAASLHLGYPWNAVGSLLAKDRTRKAQDPKAAKLQPAPVAVLRGVSFQYEKDAKR